MSALALAAGVAHADTLSTGDPADNFDLEDAVTGLDSPTSFAFLPDGRMLITDKGGDLLIADSAGATKTAGHFDVNTASEQGLLHVLLHPQFATNHLLFFYYSASGTNADPGSDADRHRVVTVPLENDTLTMAQEKILLRGLRGPANHDGGSLAIGPDGKLYIGVGDTGNNSNRGPTDGEPSNYYGTCLTTANGKILRINLDGTIPNDNPLVGKDVTACATGNNPDPRTVNPTTLPLSSTPRTEIWAWGFRNPWRFSFDSKTGNLWVGDVGEVTYEEVDVIKQSQKGSHFGWPWREGGDDTLQGHPKTACDAIEPTAQDCVDPQYFCKHGAASNGVDGNCGAVTGGVLVDSCTFPAAFQGLYFYGDSARHWVGTLTPTADRNGIDPTSRKMFATSDGQPVDFEIGPDQNVYYAVIGTSGASTIERIKPKTPATCPVNPGTGGATGSGGTTGSGGGTQGGTTGSGGTTGGGGITGGGGTTPGGGTSGGGQTGDAGSGTGNATGSLPDGGVPGAGANTDSSCGCRTVGTRNSGTAGLLFGLGALAVARRRRTRG